MKKVISLLLTALMAFSVLTVGAVSASAAEEPEIALEAGSHIYFDNTNTQWTDVYFYAWNYGYFGDSVPMEQIGDTNMYEIVVPQPVPAGAEYFLFKSAADWSGQQTPNQTVVAGKNTYKPVIIEDQMVVLKSFREETPTTEVAITPYSKTFTSAIDVTVYAFNTGDTTATYQIDDAEPIAFTEPTTITLTSTATVTVTAGTATTSCTFTKIEDAEITVMALNADGSAYTGNLYVYTYGGDRVAPGFAPMQNLGEGAYAYTLNGSAHVIFTTADNWSDAQKFLIYDMEGNLLDNQEPFVDFGAHPSYILKLS